MKKKPAIPSVEDLATLTPHELADLLSNIVLLLRRFPEIPISEISTGTQPGPQLDASALVARMRKEKPSPESTIPNWAATLESE